MLNIKEMAENTQLKQNLKQTEDYMEKWKSFDPKECNIYEGLKRSTQRELSETIRRGPLLEWATSTVRTTGSLGAAGLNYLVPTWLTTQLAIAIDAVDIGPLVAGLYAAGEQSGDLITFNAIARAHAQGTMGAAGSGGLTAVTGSQAYAKRYTSPIIVSNEMLEDNQYDLVQQAIQAAAVGFANKSNDDIVAAAKRTTAATGMTGYGAKQTAAAGADTTTPAQLAAICAQVACPSQYGSYIPDLLIASPEVWWDALVTTAGHPEINLGQGGYVATYGALNVVFANSKNLGTPASNRLTDAVTIVAQRKAAFGIARKNWLKVEKYSDPVKDLSGAVVTGKQAVAELSCAAIGILTET